MDTDTHVDHSEIKDLLSYLLGRLSASSEIVPSCQSSRLSGQPDPLTEQGRCREAQLGATLKG